jgi:hypothetical protein
MSNLIYETEAQTDEGGRYIKKRQSMNNHIYASGAQTDGEGRFIKQVKEPPKDLEQLGKEVRESIDRQREMALEIRSALLSIVATIERQYNLNGRYTSKGE